MEIKKIKSAQFQVELSYRVVGEGPKLLLIHGLCESGEIWEYHANRLASRFQILIPDLPGYGFSAPFHDNDFSLEKMQAAVFEMADAEEFEQFAVIGHSMGGYTALAMLEAQAHRISAISLFHSTAHDDTEEKKKGRNKSVRVLEQNRDLFFREVFKNLYNSERLSEFLPLAEKQYQASKQIETRTVTATLLALRDRKDRLNLLENATIPVSYFIGKHDNVLPYADLLYEAQQIGVPYHISEHSGHMGFYEEPDEVEKYLTQFMDTVK